MKTLLWLAGGTLLAMGVLAVLDIPYPVFAGGGSAADKVGAWGTKQRAFGAGGQVKGKLKQGLGNVTGSEDLTNQGAYDEVAGKVQGAVGKAATAVSNGVRSALQ